MSEKEFITLKEFFTILIDERDKRIFDKFDSMEKAVIKAEIAHEKRLESMNEFRGQLMDQSKTFIPRTEFDLVSKKVEKIENIKQGGHQTWLILVAGAGLLIGFLGTVFAILN